MRFYLFLLAFCWLTLSQNNPASAQKKQLTYEVAFKSNPIKLNVPIIEFLEWHNGNAIFKDPMGSIIAVDKLGKDQMLLDFNELSANKEVFPHDLNLSSYSSISSDFNQLLYLTPKGLSHLSINPASYEIISKGTSIDNPTFSPNNNYVAFTKNNDLYFSDLRSPRPIKVTFDGSDTIKNGYASWVYYEEILGRASNYKAFYWSPDSRKIAFLRFDDSPVPCKIIKSYNSDYSEKLDYQFYPKAGDPIPLVSLGVVDINSLDVSWFNINDSNDRYIAMVNWLDANTFIIQDLNRDQDELKLHLIDLESGTIKEIYRESDEAWVNFIDEVIVSPDKSALFFISEAAGTPAVYKIDLITLKHSRITKNTIFPEDIISIDVANEMIYLHGWLDYSTEKHLISIDYNSTVIKQLTQESGDHECHISEDFSCFVDKFSSIDEPMRIMLRNIDGTPIATLADSKGPNFGMFDLGDPQFFDIATEDPNISLPLLMILPPNYDIDRTYPVLFRVYGGPETKMAVNKFRNRHDKYFDYYLASKGIIVAIPDHRGSAHFGKEGAAKMHRKLGKWEVNDYKLIADWLIREGYANPEKIAIEGGSYGGYVALRAMLKSENKFKFGISKFPVTDWNFYDNVYTERYMDEPIENPSGYAISSLLFDESETLSGKLLITHGFSDNNVHFDHTLALIGELQSAGKQFEFMLYPNEAHGYSIYDDYNDKLELNFIFRNLLGISLQEIFEEERFYLNE